MNGWREKDGSEGFFLVHLTLVLAYVTTFLVATVIAVLDVQNHF